MRRIAAVLVALSLLLMAAPADAQEQRSVSALRLDASPGHLLEVADVGRYRGSIEVLPTAGGLTVVNELDLESYVMGIREVPGMWPMEALKAQAVAARTYALWEKLSGGHTAKGFDVCPTTACQVYQGAEAEEEERGRRWVQAVRETAGQVLLYDGRPALTRYHSSSGGRTAPNHIVFPGARALPYLMGTDDPDDAVSPLHSWTADVPTPVLDALLRPELGYQGPVTGFRIDGSTAVVIAEDGEFGIDKHRMRALVNAGAPQVAPDAFPPLRADGASRMPLTVPSPNFTLTPHEGGIRIDGRGYGHRVGMSQWGAMGRASRGAPYTDILGHYYGGLQPRAWTGETTLRVGIATGLSRAVVTGSAPIRALSPEGELGPARPGTWTVTPAAGKLSVAGPPVPTPEPTPVPTATPAPILAQPPIALAVSSPPPADPRDPRPMAAAALLAAVALLVVQRSRLSLV